MSKRHILITAPSLDTKFNISGISSVVKFIIQGNSQVDYIHFELGRRDEEKRNLAWFVRLVSKTMKWVFTLTTQKIDLVHFNFAFSKPSVVRDAPLVLFAKLIRKKMILHIHGGDYLTNSQAPYWMRFILKRVLSGNNPVLVLSQLEQTVLSNNYQTKNIQVLPNCIDTTDAMAHERWPEKTEKLNLLFLGRITTNKGIEFIYKALSSLQKEYPEMPFKFYLAGTGEDQKEYVKKFSETLGSKFEAVGVVSGKDKTDLLKKCQVFILPSLFEGLPMALLESMSFGLVPLVTSVGSIKYVVKNEVNGIFVDNEPAEKIKSAIIRLYADKPLLQKIGSSARDFIINNYNPHEYIKKLNSIYSVA